MQAVLLLLLLLLSATFAVPPAGAVRHKSGCTAAERREVLRVERHRVLERVGELRVSAVRATWQGWPWPTLRPAGLQRLPPHVHERGRHGVRRSQRRRSGPRPPGPASVPSEPSSNQCDGPLRSRLSLHTGGGWAYLRAYEPGAPPQGDDDPDLCLTAQDWFIRERSVHPGDDWTNVAVPPAEDFAGQVEANEPPLPHECEGPSCVGVPHGRMWDVDLWVGDSGVPTVAMLNPGEPISGWDPNVGEDFFFTEPAARSTCVGVDEAWRPCR